MIERERKYRLTRSDLERLVATLARLGTLDRRELQETTHFAPAEPRAAAPNLRLRTVAGRQELTVKGPRLESGPSKVRAEHTIVVSGDTTAILAALGLVPSERYRKDTVIYAFDGAVVSLDTVEGVGIFCEVEAPDDGTIERVATHLGLADETIEPRGYARLVRARSRLSGEVER